MAVKECPMCGEVMRLREREVIDRVPGTAQTKATNFGMGLSRMRLLRGKTRKRGLISVEP